MDEDDLHTVEHYLDLLKDQPTFKHFVTIVSDLVYRDISNNELRRQIARRIDRLVDAGESWDGNLSNPVPSQTLNLCMKLSRFAERLRDLKSQV